MMKIKRLYLKEISISLGHQLSVDSSKHKIEHILQGNYFLVNDTVGIPISNVKEIVYEAEVKPAKEKKVH